MKKMGKHTSTGKVAGKKQEDPGKQRKSYTIYNNCYDCPLKVYIEIVCNDNLDALIISGEPPREELEEARDRIFSEFNEMSGTSESRRTTLLRESRLYRSQIIGLITSLHIISLGEADIDLLKDFGIRYKVPEDADELNSLINKISAKISERKIRYNKAISELEKLNEREKGKKVKPMDFINQLVSLSKWAGFRIGTDVSLAEYSAYIKQMNEYVEQIKVKRNGK